MQIYARGEWPDDFFGFSDNPNRGNADMEKNGKDQPAW